MTEDASDAAAPRGRLGSKGFAAICAALWVGLLHVFFVDVDLNLWDEGFLWYGVERTLEGFVPVRDFQAYNPARYWWCALFVKLFGPGILTIRLAGSVFAALGLFCGVRVLQRIAKGPWLPLFGGLVLALWMFPRHKLFESAMSMAAVLVFLRLLESPDTRRHFQAGLFVGLAGLFGRNHLLYTGVAFLVSYVFALWRLERSKPLPKFSAAAAGGLLGLAPLFAMMAFVPGFVSAFIDSLTFFLNQPTNQALPYPWPWRLGHAQLEDVERFGVGFFFLIPVLVLLTGVLSAIVGSKERLRERLPLVAATIVGGFYLHHASVRSDVWHLAQCVAPSLLGLMAVGLLLDGRSRQIFALGCTFVLLAVSALVVPATNPALSELRVARESLPLAEVSVAGDTLRLPITTAAYIERVKGVVGTRINQEGAGDTLFVAPGHSTLYPILGRRSPFRNVYFLWSATEEDQADMARRLEAGELPWALIVDTAVDGREDLLFRNTNPRVWQALGRSFQRVATPELPPDHLLLRWRAR